MSTEPAGHRYDIDILRAIAIGSIVLFHIWPDALPGGFLGVDVFFVISGFIITRNERERFLSGRFSFVAFYKRRAKRILPSLLVTIAVTLVAALAVFEVDFHKPLLWSAFAASFAFSNITFWTEAGYFDAAAILKPLLHTWSLGLEEQFYLVWPLALVLLLPRSRAMAFVVLGGLAVASLVAAEIVVRQHPAAAFFLLPFRAFEFIVGGLIAAGAIRVPAITRHRAVSIVLAMAAMAGSMAVMDGGDPMPGLLSLVPVFGAALLILSCQERPLAPFPGLPVVRHLAQVSYSLYLVHWTVVSLGLVAFADRDGPALRIAMLAAAWALSLVLHYLVERPFRYQPHFPTAMLPAGIAGAFVVGMGVSNVLTDPFAPTPVRELPVVNANLDCARSPATAFCSADILVIGDSQAAMYTPAVRAFGRRYDLKVAQSVAPGCTPTFGARMISGEKFTAIQDACDDALRLWQAQLAKTSARLVVISARWELALADPTSGGFKTRQSFLAPPGFDGVPSLELSRRTFDTAFGDLLTALTGAGKAVVVVGQLPMQTTVGIICANRHTDSDEATAEACDATSLDAYRERAEPINSMLASLARERSRVLFIDPSSALCVDRCHLTSVGKVIYANDSHLNARGSTTVLRPYEADIDALLTPSATAG